MTYIRKNKFHLSEGQFSYFFDTKIEKTPQNKKNAFSKIGLDFFANPKPHEAMST
jgi:hypothetical protein